MIAEAIGISQGSHESCTKVLKEGNLLMISPGGTYEGQFSSPYYEILWRNRIGFAKVAIEAKTPIIPMFTENIRESFRILNFGESFFKKLYDLTRLPFRPMFSCPVKLRTYLGKPIPYDPNLTPEQLKDKVIVALEHLIYQNQRIPGNICEAFKDRFREKQTIDIAVNLKKPTKFQ